MSEITQFTCHHVLTVRGKTVNVTVTYIKDDEVRRRVDAKWTAFLLENLTQPKSEGA